MTSGSEPLLLPRIPRRPIDGHKGSFGRVLVVAGSRDMPGAAALATLGALRGGAGLVTLAAPAPAIDRVTPLIPCATLHPLPHGPDGRIQRTAARAVLDRAASCDVVVIGPGLGFDGDAQGAVRDAVRTMVAELPLPLVLDADGLNAIAGSTALDGRAAPTVLTPHPGEMARLLHEPTPSDGDGRVRCARHAATRFHATVVLKGAGTVVTDGSAVLVNTTGNPGMATGGTGDVLAGLLGALLAVLSTPLEAAAAAVHLHGLAGDIAAEARSPEALIATDLLEHLGAAFRAYPH